MASAAADKKGFKRICAGCSTRFYDFNKRPVVCPHCKAEFKIDSKAKARRGRVVAAAAAANDEAFKRGDEEAATEQVEAEAGAEDVVSLDEAAELEAAGDADEEDMDIADLDGLDGMDDDIDEVDEEEEDTEGQGEDPPAKGKKK